MQRAFNPLNGAQYLAGGPTISHLDAGHGVLVAFDPVKVAERVQTPLAGPAFFSTGAKVELPKSIAQCERVSDRASERSGLQNRLGWERYPQRSPTFSHTKHDGTK